MSTCKDCIHYEVCDRFTAPNESYPEVGGCRCFKPKSRFIELPCAVGDTVYFPMETDGECEPYVDIGTVFAIGIDERHTMWISVRYKSGLKYYHTLEDFGKTVFLAKEEAEKALAERNKHND